MESAVRGSIHIHLFTAFIFPASRAFKNDYWLYFIYLFVYLNYIEHIFCLGYEIRKKLGIEKIFLLFFDPGIATRAKNLSFHQIDSWAKTFSYDIEKIQKRDSYQIVYFQQGFMDTEERNNSKVLASDRICPDSP